MVNETSAMKTVTPIKIVSSAASTNTNSEPLQWQIEQFLPRNPDIVQIVDLSIPALSNSCEEVTGTINNKNTTSSSPMILPLPNEFGGDNPFLMVLCVTVLLQHGEHIMSKGMDYNEMAMHFDKMVRKHEVNKVLNQARKMYARYIKQYTIAQQKREVVKNHEDC